jgi:hypothetical protein
MDEAEWLTCADPDRMVAFVRPMASDRKLRLFAASCCRRIWHLMRARRSRKAIEVVERHADGGATETELAAAREAAVLVSDLDQAAMAAMYAADRPWPPPLRNLEALVKCVVFHASNAVAWAVYPEPSVTALCGSSAELTGTEDSNTTGYIVIREREEAAQVALLRDAIGNPFRQFSLDASWLTPTVVRLAQTAYDERLLPSGELDRERLAILADAVEDAGCADRQILDHLRGPGPHVRGCFALDLVLGGSRPATGICLP